MTQNSHLKRSSYFLLFSFIVQVAAVGSGALLLQLDLPPAILLVWTGGIGYLAAWLLKFPLVWRVFNALLVPGIVVYVSLGLPSGLLLFAVVLSVLIYIPTVWTGIPYYPTPPRMYDTLAAKLPEKDGFSMIDLGCGFGGLLAHLAESRPNGKFVGVEISPLPYLLSKLRFLGRSNVEIRLANFWTLDMKSFDFVYAFLAPDPMRRLWGKLRTEMRPGTTFFTNTFVVDHPADLSEEIEDGRKYTLYTHRM